MKMMKRIGVSLLAIAMTLNMFLPNVPYVAVDAATELVNVAPLGTATTENGENESHVIANVNDGNITTSWQTKGAWPSTAVIQLDMGRSISEVVVDLGEDDDEGNGNTVDVTVKYAINGVISDLVMLGQKTMGVATRHTFKPETPITASHIYVILDNPKKSDGTTAGFWPSIQEIEIYEKRDTSLSTYSNIASQALITTDGEESKTEGRDRLVDGKENTLYKFHIKQLTEEKYVLLSYEEARKMDAFRIVFENEDPDQYNYHFNFSIYAQNSETDGDTWDTIADKVTCNRTDNNAKAFTFTEKTYNQIKIVMHSCTNNTGNGIGWPAIAEFEVYGNNVTVTDKGSVANGKPVHVSSGKATASNIVDGNKLTQWKGDYYPAYADIDLEANYDLSAIEVYTPASGYSQYSIYTSLNGRDFTKLAEKTSKDSANADTGESYDATGTTARYVRVYMEYNSSSVNAYINEVRVMGQPSNEPLQTYPTLNVPEFEGSTYDVEITAQDTYEEIYGIIDRRLGTTYRDWFSFELTVDQANGYDYFEISAKEGKVHIKGNEGVSITMGLNHYLKYLCNVHISQVGDQVTMPEAIVLPENPIHMETKAKVRYSYNYCTLSYSMAFYGEKEWRDELDWLALNGANVILDATAQEEVWRRFLGKLGYDHASAKDYIAGPAYYAWAYMANLSGFGGPVHDSWFVERTELARKNQLSMRKLGMEPCLQGYSGMVPTDIKNYDANANIIAQGNWCSFQRPAMLRTTDVKFDEYAALFYACQKEVYGDVSNYYATDPFHEGGNTGGMNSADISREVLNSMLAADKDAIWVIQAWQGNPTTDLLNGLDQVTNGASHALVLDLYAEKSPHNQQTGGSYGDTKEFDDTPWVYCMLNNFGGRLGLHGHLDNMASAIPTALNNSSSMAGIGISPEASVNNPVLYDFIFESCWVEDATATMSTIDLTSWLKAYATRRYGAQSDNADEAWMILKDTVYKASLNNLGQGAPESIVNARPALSIKAASTWGNAIISYDKVLLEDALELLLKDYDQFKDNEAYMYDIANVEQQVLSNSAQEVHNRMAAAFNAKDLATFEKEANTFMEIIERMELVTGTTEYFMLGRWVEMAKDLAKNADDFTKDLYEFNAKAIVTTWGSYNQAESGGLKDYSNRQWNGLIGDFYKARWQRWIEASKMKIQDPKYDTTINWFEWEWAWARSNKEYPDVATPQNLKTLGEEILAKYSSANPATDDSKDVPREKIASVTAGNYHQNHPSQGNPEYVLDDNQDTMWHTDWNGSDRSSHYLVFTFTESTWIDSIRFLQRTAINGRITNFDLLYSKSDTDEWITLLDDCVMNTGPSWQQFKFDTVKAKQVKLVVNEAQSDNAKLFASAAEVRFTQGEPGVDKTDLEKFITDAQTLLAETDKYTETSYKALETVLAEVRLVNENENATQEQVDEATAKLQTAINGLKVLGDLINDKEDASITVVEYTSQYGNETAEKTLDRQNNTHWHSNWADTSQKLPQSILYDLGQEYDLGTISFLPRQDSSYNGDILEMNVYVGDSVSNLRFIGTYTFESGNSGLLNRNKFKQFDLEATGRYVKIEATKSAADSENNKFASMSEIRFYEDEIDPTSIRAKVEARYSSNRIYWNLVADAAGYKVLRSESIDGQYDALSSLSNIVNEYIDENAETGKMYYYKIQVDTALESYTSDPIKDIYAPGVEAVQKHAEMFLHKDYTKNPIFNGTRIETLSIGETTRVASMTQGTVLLSFKPEASDSRQIIWSIKDNSYNLGTNNGTNNNGHNNISYFVYGNTAFRYDHGDTGSYGLKASFTNKINTDEWNSVAVSHAKFVSGNNILHSFNGTTHSGFSGSEGKYDGFLTNPNISGLDLMTIGAGSNGGSTVAGFHGSIAYVTITDEIMSQAEMNEYTAAVNEKLRNTPYNIAASKVNPNIVKNTTTRFSDGTLMTGFAASNSLSNMYDGNRNTNNYFEFGSEDEKPCYVEVDLGAYYDVSSINALFYYKAGDERHYDNVVVLVSENRQFTINDVVYNNDVDGVHDFGAPDYSDKSNDTSEGRTIEFDTRKARFVRIYMAGNNKWAKNHIVELEVYGIPSETPEFTTEENQVDIDKSEWLYESTIDGKHNYVSPDVLRVKAQSEKFTDEAGTEKVNVRFVSSVASTNLEQVGFKVEVINGDKIRTNSVKIDKVYKKIAENINGEILFKEPQEVFDNTASEFFFVAKLNNIPLSAANQLVRVTPYWLPLGYEDVESNYVEGVSRTFVIQEFFDNAKQ